MNKHTQGPWIADEDGWIKGGDGEVIEYAGCGSHKAYWSKQEDKALVLAAPDLLEALSEIINDGGKFVMTHELHRKARAAIARARGEA